jgi:hypothetical protein
MTTSQVPFDALDWVQFGIYFAALPLVALLGASLGLLGRLRRGGMLWSTNVGLLGGAVTCMIVAAGISSLEGESITNYFSDFLESFRWQMLAVTLGATAGCALAAAIAWRCLYAPREKQPFAFSIGAILLVQFFALISMSSWIGLRLYMLETSNTELQKWIPEVSGWAVLDGGKHLQFSHAYSTADQVREALSPPTLSQIAALQQLETIELFLDGDWNIDLSPLFSSRSFKSLKVHCVNPSEFTLKQLAAAKTTQLWLIGDYSNSNLAPLTQSDHLEHLTILGRASRRSLESLAESSTITAISLAHCELTPDKPAVERWPPKLNSLNITGGPINHHDLAALSKHRSLRWLYVDHILEEDEALSAIASMPALEYLHLKIGRLTPSGWSALASLKAQQVRLHIQHPALSTTQVLPLMQMKGLRYLDLIDATHGDDVVETLSSNESLQTLSISSPAISENAMLALATHPNLTVLEYPKHLDSPSFHCAFEFLRTEANLPSIQYMAPIVPDRAPSLPPTAGVRNATP